VKKIFGVLLQHLGAIFRDLAKHKEVEVLEEHLMSVIVPELHSTHASVKAISSSPVSSIY
jgi:hypothetical protein